MTTNLIGTDLDRQRAETIAAARLVAHLSTLSAEAGLPHVAWRALVTINDDGSIDETVSGPIGAGYGGNDVRKAVTDYADAWGDGVVLDHCYDDSSTTATAMVTVEGRIARVFGIVCPAVTR